MELRIVLEVEYIKYRQRYIQYISQEELYQLLSDSNIRLIEVKRRVVEE